MKLARLLIFGALNWSVQWFDRRKGASLDELTDAALLRLFLRYPLMTLKVVVAIHFEAVRLMLKGIRRHPHAPLAEQGTFSRNPR